MKNIKRQSKRAKKTCQRRWGLAKRLEHTRIKGKQKRK
jgi:hypothetical protein